MLRANDRFSPIYIIVFSTFMYEALRGVSFDDPIFKLHHYFSSLYTRQLHNSSAISFRCPTAMFKYFFQYSSNQLQSLPMWNSAMMKALPFIHQSDRAAPLTRKANDVSAFDWRYETHVKTLLYFFRCVTAFLRLESLYDTAVYMINTNICKMSPEMFDPAGAIIA